MDKILGGKISIYKKPTISEKVNIKQIIGFLRTYYYYQKIIIP